MEAFENDIFPDIGKHPIAEIKPLEVLSTLRKLEKRGVLDKLRKIRQACNQVFRYAIVTGRAETNPVSELASALTAPKSTITPICSLMNSLISYKPLLRILVARSPDWLLEF